MALVNKVMARHRWPNQDPIGKKIRSTGGQHWIAIAGVVANAKEYGLDHAVQDEVYRPALQTGYSANLVLRTSVDPATVVPAVRATLHEIDPRRAMDRVDTMEHLRYESMASPRASAMLLGLFAVCHYTTHRRGGRGVAREVIELILKSQGRWEAAVPLALA